MNSEGSGVLAGFTIWGKKAKFDGGTLKKYPFFNIWIFKNAKFEGFVKKTVQPSGNYYI